MLDHTDMQILQLLKQNCKTPFRDIGEIVHLTGQAVSNRIARLEELGVIKGYSVVLDDKLLGKTLTAYATVFMKTADHGAFHAFVKQHEAVAEAARISGDGCYWLKVRVSGSDELAAFLDAVLSYGNYRVAIAIGTIK
jgi:Lrp/AsnC family leucine-responsive transcriptional regulator